MMGFFILIANGMALLVKLDNENRNILQTPHELFKVLLCLANVWTGIFLLVLGIIDLFFQGRFTYNYISWKNGIFCRLNGALALASMEASLLLVLGFAMEVTLARKLNTLDPKVLLIAARVYIAFSLTVALVISIIPLFPMPYFSEFYGHSIICLPLFLVPHKMLGWEYSVSLFLGLNQFGIILLALNTGLMFFLSRAQSKPKRGSQRRRERKVNKTMLLLMISNIISWMPVIFINIFAVLGNQH